MKRIHTLALAGLLLAGCSSQDQTGAGPTAPQAATPSASADTPLDLCQLMPVADVAALLQANGADTVTEQKAGAGGMCAYLHVPQPGDYRTRLLIDFTRMPSADQAKAALAARRQDFADRGVAVTPVPDLGDEAFVAEAEGAEGLKLRIGDYQGQINLQVEGRQPATLRPAVLALGKQVTARLH
ncbi:hypothetical protein [Fulvimonas yonginensis]|uniref:DUF3558 domain-containing protein n=1 Tax=Fulvimonas yonginensis TaxID=1495200 RepID=A0ABU8JF15_9GAMM